MKYQHAITVESRRGKMSWSGLTACCIARPECCGCVGTSRGEADGFALDILSKLKDVKSKVSVSAAATACVCAL